MSVHYKFKSALEYDTVTFDGLHISVKDLKNAIIQQKRIGKNTDFDLQVTNAQTKEIYEDEEALIPKNTSLLIARIPLLPSNKSKTWDGYGNDNAPVARTDEGGPIAKAVDLSSLDASEDDKIRAMMSQSTQDYDPSNYLKIRGANQVGTVPPNYRCYKCHQTGHWIKDCPLSQGSEPMEIKKSTGIPRSFMVPVEGPQVQGAMMTPNGSYAVPVLDHQTYTQKQPAPPLVHEEQPEIPEDLICSICSGLLTDAVMIPCCGNSFCDECIRSCLLESEEHECPDCHERDISPGTLIPNRYLRNSVANFKNTTGYVKKPTYKPQSSLQQTVHAEIDKKEELVTTDGKDVELTEADKSESIEKTIISEADSTEPPKNVNVDFSKDIDLNDISKESPSKSSVSEGPPGVSPRREKSPKRQASRRGSHTTLVQNNGRPRRSSKEISPRQHTTRRTPPYEPLSRIEERPGTPTVDEPGGSNVGNNVYPPTSAPYPSGPPPGILPPMIGMPPPHLQGPPPNYSTGQPPPGVFSSQGPPPNFRLPPPGANPPAPFVPGPYNAPPRPIFDPTRPPMQGPPPNYTTYPPRTRNRDYRDSSRMRTRTPPGIIDDPLEAFNRMLREKDERDRRAKQKKGRSYSRSSSRSYSRSPKRPRSRSPRRRNSRSRSRSFSMSRSRSRSFSPSPRNSPYRDYSPRNSSPRRRPPSRFRSPARSPPARYRYKEPAPINDRNRERDFDRPPPPQRDRDRGYSRDRDYNYYDRGDRGGRWGGGAPSRPLQDNYYPPEVHQLQPPPPTNRYPPRDNYQPYINKNEPPPPHHLPPILPPPVIHPPPQRRFEDIAPPGTDQPPIPGEEVPPRYDERYSYQQEQPTSKERFGNDRETRSNKEEERRNYDKAPNREEDKNRRMDRYSRSPTRGYKSPGKTRERHDSLDKHKRRKREHSEEKDRGDKRDERHERKREISDDEKSKRSKDKKKKREKKELEKKKRREKKEKKEQDKAKKEEKDKKREKSEKSEGEDKEGSIEKYQDVKDKPDKREEKIDPIRTPEKVEQELPKIEKIEKIIEPADLYDDLLSDGVDKSIVKNYGKLDSVTREDDREKTPELPKRDEIDFKDDNEYPPESETSKDEDVLDIHANEAELKAELEKSEVLAPLPEKSKWEMDDDISVLSVETQKEGKQERNGKVTTEVLKRAENAIFAKAINAIRPIEIKKISMDRAKLYSGEREKDRKSDETDMRNIQVTISSAYDEDVTSPGNDAVKVESEIQKPPRLSVKERLGVKVDDLERIVKVQYDRNRSRSLSPLSKRAREEKLHLDRRMEIEDRRPDRARNERDRYHRNFRNLDRAEFRRREEFLRRERDRREEQRREERHERSHSRKEEPKRKRTRSRSESKEHKHRKKDKKLKKDKNKKHKRDDKEESKSKDDNKADKKEDQKPKSATDRRKATLDEANFEPDYDLESESEKEDKKSPKETAVIEEEKKRFKPDEKDKESSSTESSDSSSEDDRKRKKHRKHKKKKSRKETSSSSSSSDSDSSEEERERKRKKHKKKQKKRKKSKHK